jgi:hypothetical protein
LCRLVDRFSLSDRRPDKRLQPPAAGAIMSPPRLKRGRLGGNRRIVA